MNDQVYSWFWLVTMVLVLVVILSCVLAISANGLHQEIQFSGCTENYMEDMIGLDGEEIMFADFEKGTVVNCQPEFAGKVVSEGFYERALNRMSSCKQLVELFPEIFKDYEEQRVEPSTPMVYPRDELEMGKNNSLVCHVTGFYPPPVTIYWKKNGENVTEGITYNVPLFNRDSTFHQFSKLEFIPQQGDVYSCSVRHMTLDQPKTRQWEMKQTDANVGPAVLCGIGVTVGVLGVAAGIFFIIKEN
ncbi:RLA class II histocompatibility antigen, DP alpha-1 chain-like [Cheilinus undulatus]|uniref:RLA class II histocompatibility antigen, DP alpha-1 chain-like n=1 Tax=Cheilinus undulatus TaxID=241271 RepID=UPI001BD3E3D5|nr:RLA class II histocompatibility antigen, DP alpha-1 chain-like [Cheilinus undulatus]